MKKILSVFLLGMFLSVSAEVFSLWPFSGHDERMNASPDALLRPSNLWTEKIKANGMDLDLRVALISTPFRNCMALLRKNYPDARFAANKKNIIMERKLPDGSRERTLLIAIDGIYPVMQFSLVLPAKRSVAKEWPGEFPLLPGAKPVTVMYFPKRSAVYGMFHAPMNVRNALPQMISQLASRGWQPVSNENIMGTGSGEVFLNEAKKEILIIGFSNSADGSGCMGTLYKKPYSD
ncbi:MAG: hypothetical protein IJW23_07120 [Lentisphaeria bacterium]|nr:hypothetical protein [Lentisphaeria bacterium]